MLLSVVRNNPILTVEECMMRRTLRAANLTKAYGPDCSLDMC